MEVRGLGIINVLDLFGITATRERLPIDLIVHLVDWTSVPNPDRTGLVEQREKILDVEVPMVYVLVRPGRNIATIIEVASRNAILKKRGTFSAQRFHERVLRDIAKEADTARRTRAKGPASGRGLGRGRRAEAGAMNAVRIVIISGLSGSGKSTAVKALEDLGFYCVDNLPVVLVTTFADLCRQSAGIAKVALVVDVREGEFLRTSRHPPELPGSRTPRGSFSRRATTRCLRFQDAAAALAPGRGAGIRLSGRSSPRSAAWPTTCSTARGSRSTICAAR
jgi:hypothetical protein